MAGIPNKKILGLRILIRVTRPHLQNKVRSTHLLIVRNSTSNLGGGVAQFMEGLPSRYKVMGLSPSTT